MSEYYGRGDKKNLIKTLRYSLIISAIIGLIMMIIVMIFSKQFSYIFGLSDEARELFMQSAIFFTSPFVSLAVMKISMNYFYSQKKNIYAYLIVYLEPIIVLLLVFVFPIFMGTNGIWISQTIAQIIPAIIAIILMLKLNRKEKEENAIA